MEAGLSFCAVVADLKFPKSLMQTIFKSTFVPRSDFAKAKLKKTHFQNFTKCFEQDFAYACECGSGMNLERFVDTCFFCRALFRQDVKIFV